MKKNKTFSKNIKKYYGHFFAEEVSVVKKMNLLNGFRTSDTYLGWSYNANTKRAERKSDNVLRLEDGLIRSIGMGEDKKSWSLIKNKIPYFNSRIVSDFELLVEGDNYEGYSEEEIQKCISTIKKYKITKYNDWYVEKHKTKAKILIIDQVPGDNSIKYGVEKYFTLQEIINDLKQSYPGLGIDIKKHPAIEEDDYNNLEGVNGLILGKHNIHDIIEEYEYVATRTSQVGFEALFHSKKVICYGVPFYAGWGLTIDRDVNNEALKRRTKKLSIEKLFYKMMVQNTEYRHPGTKEEMNILEVIEEMNNLILTNRENHGTLVFLNISWWKRSFVRDFYSSVYGNEIVFVSKRKDSVREITRLHKRNPLLKVIHWGEDMDESLVSLLDKEKIQYSVVEEGFIRSKEIGAKRTRPFSLVNDKNGIYFNPKKPSFLENMLISDLEITEAGKKRAGKLIGELKNGGISKYNNAKHKDLKIESGDKTVVLIPGQVNDDASVRYGTTLDMNNEKLIKLVRKNNPNAYIIYKPHPDVLAGKRLGTVSKNVIDECINEVLVGVSLSSCIKISDEVHTITSLSGFEGLMYEKKVFCYGVPFYAGWGLTIDEDKKNPALKRRNKKRTIEELFYLTYIKYPRYYSKEAEFWVTPEYVIKKLMDKK